MRIKCPECGKFLQLSESKLGQRVRCPCKNVFKADENLIVEYTNTEVIEDLPEATEVLDQGPKLQDFVRSKNPDQVISETQGTLSDDEIDQHLVSLRKGKPTAGQESSDPSRPLSPMIKEIEIDESSLPKKQPDIPPPLETESDIFRLKDSPPTTNENPIQSEPSFDLNELRRSKGPPPKTRTDRVNELFQNKFLWGVVGTTSVIVLLLVVLLQEEPPPPPPDPYLTKLLTPQTPKPDLAPPPAPAEASITKEEIKAPEAVAESPKEEIPPPIEEKPPPIEVKPPPQKERSSTKAKKGAADTSLYTRFYRWTVGGNFKAIVTLGARQKKLKSPEMALYLEALTHEANQNVSAHQKVRSSLNALLKKDPRSNHFLRALAWSQTEAPGSLRNLNRSTATLKSLSLSRPNDPLVFAYLGFALEKSGQIPAAHRAWDQALTIEPKLTWVFRHRERLYRAAGDTRSANRMRDLSRKARSR